ncbi:MAG: thiamine pyrophosphate-binding protein [Candidatus Marinimicrobia bacterium]|jgi:acetolactate synthase-1/2/3 large subunit|nr:thiamine pyrophosphate-binding protein [Candidatus Neomarinimicrobiota bacterium]MDP7060853.1 thiamine pyrophosphate-binding protein [Candidatus Neomarinimicrobiota bacterium]|tara:strand:- start:95 stop:1828 length:1734 start_codon:yes stop_codon:yes gene_type:complete
MSESSYHGGHKVADVLLRHGTDHLFTLCGSHISPILVAAKEKNIRVIDVRHEVTAVFAADAVTRLSDKPGVAAITAGPGLTNALTAVKNAQMAQSPVILLGGATATALKGKGALQDIDQMALVKPHVKWTATVKRYRDIEAILEKAFAIAYAGIPGPVFIEFPVDLLYPESFVRSWYGLTSDSEGNSIEKMYMNWHLNRLFGDRIPSDPIAPKLPYSHPRQDHIQNAARMIESAKRPVLLVSSQAMLSSEAVPSLREAVLKLAIPTYLSGAARGLLNTHDSIFLRQQRSDALKQADLVVLAGAPFDFRLSYGRKIPRTTTVISINRSKHDLNLNRKPALGILADPAVTILSIADICNKISSGWEDWLTSLKEAEQEREKEIEQQAGDSTGNLNPVALLKKLDSHLSDNTVLVADGGDFVATASYIISPRGPLAWLDPGPFGTLGVGAGFALGAKVCRPDSDVWIIYGDGSVAYSLAEFDTFTRHKLPVIALVGNDAGWTQITRNQVNILEDDVGTTLTHTDYHTVADGYGGKGLLLDSDKSLEKVLNESLEVSRGGQSVLINAILDKTDFRDGSISI